MSVKDLLKKIKRTKKDVSSPQKPDKDQGEITEKAMSEVSEDVLDDSAANSKKASLHSRYKEAFEKYAVITHIPVSLIMCFILEWMARHSFVATLIFARDHTISFLYNAFLIYVVFSFSLIVKKRSFVRWIIGGFFIILGIINGVLLLNRVSPFGFTDLYMVTDLLTMQDSKYFSIIQEILVVLGLGGFIFYLVMKFIKGKKVQSNTPFWIRFAYFIAMVISVPLVTLGLQQSGHMASYFGNLAQGYSDYGYLYGFMTSAVDRGMSKPINYSKSNVQKIVKADSKAVGKSKTTQKNGPNIVVVLLESYFDPTECKYLSFDKDPVPFYHSLQKTNSWGHLTVPVVGAGTCNTEFEVLTGMSCQFFGPGEYPQKTILKKTDCESIADVLKDVGYGSHVVHNNGGNFYSRANAFSQMGFDTFTCKENLDITDYTPLGTWPTDDILIGATKDSMDSTPGKDFVYTITVGTHGAYPTYDALGDNKKISVKANGKSQAENYAWEYYVNQINAMDTWMKNYTEMLDARGEDTLLIMFGDHLPSMNILDSDMASDNIFKTDYITWNNFGMSKEDADLTSYQLVSSYLDRLNIHGGTMVDYNQRMSSEGVRAGSMQYMSGLENLQYDLLYGKKYAYNGKDLYPASKLLMGVHEVTIDHVYTYGGKVHIFGDNFNKWCKVYINGEKVPTSYESGQILTIKDDAVKDGDEVVVNQVGSSDTIFRSSNKYKYSLPATTANTSTDSDSTEKE
jgi:phosphoglycerol transferase MdoB-like AlkP superfamily enzyme